MRVVLINPPSERKCEKYDSPISQHIGLGYLASAIESAGHTVRLLDAKLERLDFDNVISEIDNFRPDVIGFTAMTHEINVVSKLVNKLQAAKDIRIVVGGVHISALPEETLKMIPDVDFGIIGEGEESFIKLLSFIENGKNDWASINGLAFRGTNGNITWSYSNRIEDLDSLPCPNCKHFPNAKVYNIIATRGCPYSCVFCMQAMGRKVRKRSIGNIIYEIENAIKCLSPEQFIFYDETFSVDKKFVHRLCDEIISRGIHKKIKWVAMTRADSIDEPTIKKMKDAGLTYIEFGVESGNNEVLKRIRKGISKEDALYAVGLAKKYNIKVGCDFILGHPYETLETALDTIKFASELNPDIINLGIMVPYPGTTIREKALKKEWGYKIISNNWSDYNKELGNALELENLCRADLEKLQLLGYMRLFLANRRYLDFIKFAFKYRKEALGYIKNVMSKRGKQRKGRLKIMDMIRIIFAIGERNYK